MANITNMTNNDRWLNVLKKLKIYVTDDIKEGELLERKLIKDNSLYRFLVSFPRVLPFEVIRNLLENLDFGMKTNFNIGVRLTIKYQNEEISDSLLEGYLKNSIITWSNVKKDFSMLNKYTYDIKENLITFNVPSENEGKVIQTFFGSLNNFFKNYGLNNISIYYEVDDSLTDTATKRKNDFMVTDNHFTAESNEKYQKSLADAKENQYQDSSTNYKSNKDIELSIKNIPLTSMEVEEFRGINGTDRVRVSGILFKKDLTSGVGKNSNKPFRLFSGIITDNEDSIVVKKFYNEADIELFEKNLVPGTKIVVTGKMEFDSYSKAVIIMAYKIDVLGNDTSRQRFDGSLEKRVELHAHTKMSIMDSILDVEEYVKQAKRYGHTALAVTDHENCHVIPEFYKLCKKNQIKPIIGVETNYINSDDLKIALTDENIDLNSATFVIFDLETTGFCINYDSVIEIGAVKVAGGMIIDQFSTFVKPKFPISEYIENLTHISNDMVYDAPSIEMVIPEFKKFIEGCVLVGHNVKFDSGFIYDLLKKHGIYEHDYPIIDTIMIARAYYGPKGLKRFNLASCAKFLHVEVEQQHRAIHDAKTTNNVFMKMLGDLGLDNINNYQDLNSLIGKDIYKYVIPTHINLLVKNKVGLKNFYKIISDSHTNHYFKTAKLVDPVLDEYHEGLLVGSGCVNGEVFKAAYEKTVDDLKRVMAKYDYIEVQPPTVYKYLYENVASEGSHQYLLDTIKLIVDTAKAMDKIVVATGDVHELIKEDCKYRKIYLSVARPNGGGPHELAEYKDELDMHFRNTEEMIQEFSFLGNDVAYEIVVTNTNKISDMIEEFELFSEKLFVPADDFRKDQGVPSMKQAIYDLCNETSKSIYGEVLPQYVKDRMDKELDAIISHGYFSVYYISHLLVKNSNENGYIVGSRGSVGSSFVAFLMHITDVNALVPHYVCPNCKFSAFKFSNEQIAKYPQPNVPDYILDKLSRVENGYDLEECDCPMCGSKLDRAGIDIQFETFLGFTGEKCPDIDLNFSGEYQAKAHTFVQEVFGKEYAFRAGTVTAVMDKTAFAYARDYYEKNNIPVRQAELERLAVFLAGAKKTTGQHPGGIVVVPNYMDIYDVTPIQFPPVDEKDDLENMQWRTSHYDYHSFEANLLKLDILGHDDPTLMKHLLDYVHKFPEDFPFDSFETIPLIDKNVISLFSSKEVLHMEGDDMDELDSGTMGIPEFGTDFVRGMLKTIQPTTYNDIIKVSGLAHGTNVWYGNAESLVTQKIPNFPKVAFHDVIGCRDDIMAYLISIGIPAALSFKTMEGVRKGKGLTPEQKQAMVDANVPEWFIWSCEHIHYLFPKAHAAAYVMNALRICWFKIYRPIYYYAVYFSIRAKELDAEVFALGKNAIRNKINEIKQKMKDKKQTDKEENLYDSLKIALEMILRGYSFKQIDLNRSLATEFEISDDKQSLYLPFTAVEALGDAVANSIVAAREVQPFTSKKDFERRTSINKSQFAKLLNLGVFDNLPDDDPNTLF